MNMKLNFMKHLKRKKSIEINELINTFFVYSEKWMNVLPWQQQKWKRQYQKEVYCSQVCSLIRGGVAILLSTM